MNVKSPEGPNPPEPGILDYVSFGGSQGALQGWAEGHKLGGSLAPAVLTFTGMAASSAVALGSAPLVGAAAGRRLAVATGFGTMVLGAFGAASLASTARACGAAVGGVVGQAMGAAIGAARGLVAYASDTPLNQLRYSPEAEQLNLPLEPEPPPFKASTLARTAAALPAATAGLVSVYALAGSGSPVGAALATAAAMTTPLLAAGAAKAADMAAYLRSCRD